MPTQVPAPTLHSTLGNRTIFFTGVAATIMAVVVVAAVALIHLRQVAEMRMVVATQNLARSLEQTFDGLIDTVDVSLLAAADEISRQMTLGKVDAGSVVQLLNRQKERLVLVDHMWASNENGDVIYGPLDIPTIKDRDYFTLSRDDHKSGLTIGKIVVGRVNSKWIWIFSRRIGKPDGTFGGVVFAVLLIDQIENMLAHIKMGPGGAISLRDASQALIARRTFGDINSIPTADTQLSAPFRVALGANPQEGTYVSDATARDSLNRTYSYRRSTKYGFTVNVGIAQDIGLADWRNQVWIISGLAAAFIIASLAFAWEINRAWLRQEQYVAALRRSEEKLAREGTLLAQQNQELEQFSYVASHDLRQPLRMVTSYLLIIEKRLGPQLEGDLKKYFGNAVDGAKRMDRLITALLDYSRTGKYAELAPVPLGDPLTDALNNLAAAIAESAAKVSIPDQMPSVLGDKTDLMRVFQNLIGNAIKYRSPDRLPVVEVGWRDYGQDYIVWVKDNGIGIATGDQEKAFQIFQRLVPKDAYEGTGIGLAVCKKIVEHFGGKIWIESEVGEGSTFFMTFPIPPSVAD